MKYIFRSKLRLLSIAVIVVAMPACVSLGTDLLENSYVSIERAKSNKTRVRSVYVHQTDSGIRITARLRRLTHNRRGAVDIEVISPSGEVLAFKHVTYSTQTRRGRLSRFTTQIPITPQKGSLIRIRDHDKSAHVL